MGFCRYKMARRLVVSLLAVGVLALFSLVPGAWASPNDSGLRQTVPSRTPTGGPTNTPVPPTATPVPPTATRKPSTEGSEPTATQEPPTATPPPPTATPPPPTATRKPTDAYPSPEATPTSPTRTPTSTSVSPVTATPSHTPESPTATSMPTNTPVSTGTPASLTGASSHTTPVLPASSPEMLSTTRGPQLAADAPATVEPGRMGFPAVEARPETEPPYQALDEAEEAAAGPYLAAGLALVLVGTVVYLIWRRPELFDL